MVQIDLSWMDEDEVSKPPTQPKVSSSSTQPKEDLSSTSPKIDLSWMDEAEDKPEGEAEVKPEGEAEVKSKEEDSSFIGGLVDDVMDSETVQFGKDFYEGMTSDEPDLESPDTGYFGKPTEKDVPVMDYILAGIGSATAVPFQLAELAGEAIETQTGTSYTKDIRNAITNINQTLKREVPGYRRTVEQLQGDDIGAIGRELTALPAALSFAGLTKKAARKKLKKLIKDKDKASLGLPLKPKTRKLSKETTAQKIKTRAGKTAVTVGSLGAGTIVGAGIESLAMDEDTNLIAGVFEAAEKDGVSEDYVDQAINIINELAINPDDTRLQKRAKQFQETLAFYGAGTLFVKAVQIALKIPKAASRGIKKLTARDKAIKEGVTDAVPDGKNIKQTGSEIVEEVDDLGDPVIKQRGKFTEVVGKINTAAGRVFQSYAALPKELAKLALERSRSEKGFTLRIKNNVEQLQRAQKKDNVSDESLAKYINDNIDDGLSENVKKKADQIKDIITRNESNINRMLGLKGDKQIGLGFNDGDVYFTRTFEANNNPAYLKKIIKATEFNPKDKGKKIDADFIKKVEDARVYFRNNGWKDATKDELDGAIVHLVRRLSGDEQSLIRKMWDEGDVGLDSGIASQAAKVLKQKKKLDEPILNLLGEQKDPYAKISATLTNQNKLLAEINYLSQVDNFFRRNAGKEIELGGLIPKLPKARTGVKEGDKTVKESADLYSITEETLGKFGGNQGQLLRGLHVSPQMANFVRNGLDVFNPRDKVGGVFTRAFAQINAYGQSTQTIMDLPAYAINTYGAFQSLASNGLLFSPSAWRNAIRATQTFGKSFGGRRDDQKTRKAIQRLELLKRKGVIDTDLTSEMISNNINIYGKQIGSKYGKIGKAYSKSMDKLSTAYGTPDTYAKILAFEGEFAALQKVFPRLKGEKLYDYEERLFDMAADRVRDTIPSYSVAAPAARMLSRLPFGTYALFPAEMVRTTKNIIKYGLKDIKDGLKNNNKRQTAMGLRRLSGLAVTATGVDYVVSDNNKQLGINDTTNRIMDVLSPEWGKNSARYHNEGIIEREDGKIMTHFINSGSVDALDYIKVPVRAIIGKLLSGKEISEFEVDDIIKGMSAGLVGPYTNPKFLTEAAINLAQKDFYSDVPGEEGATKENAIRILEEIGSALEPGTLEAARKYLQSLTSERVRGIGEGINAYGFPQSSKDIETWMMSGVRPVKMDVKKSMGFNMSEDIKKTKVTQDAFIQRLGKLDDQPFTPKLRKEIIEEYKNLQEAKFGAMQKLSDKVNLFSQLEYQNKNNETEEFGIRKVLEAATSDFNYKIPAEIIYASAMTGGVDRGIFIADDIHNDRRLLSAIDNKSFQRTLINDLAEEYKKFTGRTLRKE